MKRIEDIKEFEDIDTYYEISKIVEEVFQDRVETHKHLVTANKEISRLNKEKMNFNVVIRNEKPIRIDTQGLDYMVYLEQKYYILQNIIKEVREYIEKYDFITGYYEYNYDDGNDTYTHYTVKEELLEILDKENKE